MIVKRRNERVASSTRVCLLAFSLHLEYFWDHSKTKLYLLRARRRLTFFCSSNRMRSASTSSACLPCFARFGSTSSRRRDPGIQAEAFSRSASSKFIGTVASNILRVNLQSHAGVEVRADCEDHETVLWKGARGGNIRKSREIAGKLNLREALRASR